MDAQAERICVLGGGFGGLYTALRLQKMPWRGRKPIVTLVDKRDKFTFLPLLYEFAGGWEGFHRAAHRTVQHGITISKHSTTGATCRARSKELT